MNKTILVTGAGGFIGSFVVRRTYRNLKVVAAVSPYSTSDRLGDIKDKIKIEKIDLTHSKKVDNLLGKYKPHAVLHMATHGVYQYQQKDEERISSGNYLMTLNLLSAAKKHEVFRFINTGSVFEYGSQNKKVKEGDVKLDDVLNRYSATKMATTALTNSFSSDFKVITLRPFTTYGPGEDASRFIFSVISRANKNEDIHLVKDVVRDFVYVEDVADAYKLALLKDFKSGEIVNIASGKRTTLEEVAKAIKQITKSQSRIIFDDIYKRKKDSACWADIEKAKKVLNWTPKHSMLQGLNKMLYSYPHAK